MERAKLRSGLTWRSMMALSIELFMLGPMALYLSLAGGGSLYGAPALYVVLLLFTCLARYFGTQLTVQEVFIIYYLLGVAMNQTLFLDLIFRAYMRICPVAFQFVDPISGKSIPEILPAWYSPPSSIREIPLLTDPARLFSCVSLR